MYPAIEVASKAFDTFRFLQLNIAYDINELHMTKYNQIRVYRPFFNITQPIHKGNARPTSEQANAIIPIVAAWSAFLGSCSSNTSKVFHLVFDIGRQPSPEASIGQLAPMEIWDILRAV